MNIFNFMNQKLTAARKGKKTGINFPYLNKIKNSEMDLIMKKVYLN